MHSSTIWDSSTIFIGVLFRIFFINSYKKISRSYFGNCPDFFFKNCLRTFFLGISFFLKFSSVNSLTIPSTISLTIHNCQICQTTSYLSDNSSFFLKFLHNCLKIAFAIFLWFHPIMPLITRLTDCSKNSFRVMLSQISSNSVEIVWQFVKHRSSFNL